MADATQTVLFLCTGNSARSVLAEAILNRRGAGRVRAYSAGSHPTGAVHPAALALLAERGHPTGELRSKSWQEFAASDAPPIDFVFTVCDAAAAEACPVWPGGPLSAHWGLPDPATCTGSEREQRAVFAETYRRLDERIARFLALDQDGLDAPALRARLAEIGASGTAAGS